MHYKESPLYETLLPREKKHLDKFMEEAPENRTSETLEEQIKIMKFKNRELIVNLFNHTDEAGNIIQKRSEKRGITMSAGSPKDTFKKNAYRRWKRKGLVTITNDKEFVNLKGIKYEIVKEGRSIKLISPGQTTLIPNEEKKANVKRTKTK